MTHTPGDPAGMRWKASDLRARAADVRARIDRVRGQAAGMHFQGPAADRFRQQIAQWQRETEAVAYGLEQTAAYLQREASTLEQVQRAEARAAVKH
jgi:uncharacterized protein YukE